jgi:hypothetical protein
MQVDSAGILPSPTQIRGKVLRVDRDGKAAPGNNPPAGFDKRIFAYGFRNPQGVSFRPGTNEPFISENGPWHSDEVTKLENGGNGGWDPRDNRNGRGPCPDNYCGYSPNQMGALPPAERSAFMPMTDLKTYPTALKPAWNNEGQHGDRTDGTMSGGRRLAARSGGGKGGSHDGGPDRPFGHERPE